MLCRFHQSLFDTDGDRLKPESAAVIRTMAHGLEANPGLKLLIEGHTDSTGSADHNRDLSMRRAEPVKTALFKVVGMDGSFANVVVKVPCAQLPLDDYWPCCPI